MFLILLSIVFIIFVVHKLIHNSKSGILLNQIPGHPIFPVLGNGITFVGSSVVLFYRLRSIANQFRTISKIWAAHLKVVNIYDPDDIEIVLSSSKHITKGHIYRFLHPWLKEGLLTSTGDKWHNRRKILTPTFHFNILRQFCTVFVEHTENLVEKLRKEVGKSETEVLPFIRDFALKAVCETAMGTNLEIEKTDMVEKYTNSIHKLAQVLLIRLMSVWYHPDVLYNWTSLKRNQDIHLEILHKFTSDVISERRRTRNSSSSENNNEHLQGSRKRMAMLDLLLTAEENGQINDAGIREEVDTFMFEGHDTITTALMYALMILANHPEVQDKIVAEINEIQGDSKSPITIEELNKMRYLERCIKEALRLYPSVPFMNRQILEDIPLKNYTIPAGTLCNIHSFDIHRNERLFPNPDKFDPDRFLPENSINRHPFSYIPFSAGPRNCIGQKFAILEEKAVIAAIVKNFKMEAVTRPEDIIFSCDLVLRCVEPIKIKFLSRNNN